MEKVLGILILMFTSVLIVGCSDNNTEAEETVDKSEQAIRAVIEGEFNGPDEKYKALWERMAEAQIAVKDSEENKDFLESPEYQDLMNYTEETYASYFTENGYDYFINATPAFLYNTGNQEYELKPSNIEFAHSEKFPTHYDFTFQVEYTDANGESKIFNIKGNAIAPEEGKIGKIEYMDENGLIEEIRNNE